MSSQQSMLKKCVIEAALDEQALRLDMAANIHHRRIELRVSVQAFASLIGCSESDFTRLEAGLLFHKMPMIRMRAFEALERMESREEGRRNGENRTSWLRVV